MVNNTEKPKLTSIKNTGLKQKLPFECVALLLQGGGALGAYQAGVYQALSEAGVEPDWVAGISIGAINASIIAGNAPENRVKQLRAFWELVTKDEFQFVPPAIKALMTRDSTQHQALNVMSAMRAIMCGIPGFFSPRTMMPWLDPQASMNATSFCDFSALQGTLESLVDFDRLNNGGVRYSIGAVNVLSGNFTDFDNKKDVITPAHVMASSALPPGFPPVQIGNDYYWDGGLISNTPLHWVVENESYLDTLVFQVDLWSADGEFPQNMADVLTRCKDIQYSSRTRASTNRFKDQHELRHNIARLMDKLPAELKNSPEAKMLAESASDKVYNIVHLIYHNKAYEGYSKDVEFSRLSMEEHWQSGYKDTIETLEHPEVLQRPQNREGIAIYDFSQNEQRSLDMDETSKKEAL